MPEFSTTGKNIERINGRYLVQTTANIIWWSEGADKRFMTKVFDLPASTKSKCFIIEGYGDMLWNDAVTEMEMERLGNAELKKNERGRKFNFELNTNSQ